MAWKLRQSPRLGKLWLTDTQNAGLASLGTPCPVKADWKAPFYIRHWCDQEQINLIIVGPEGPLAEGAADAMSAPGRAVFGPVQAGAQIEADKAFAKQLMRQAAIPTAEARIFDQYEPARAFVMSRDLPCVVKASGLAAGKGVVVCNDGNDALAALDRMMVQQEFGEAGLKVVVEEKLSGPEVSLLALVDGRTIWILDSAQDHKRVGEGDRGPNTGGMGAYSPTTLLNEKTLSIIEREIFVPTVDALRREGIEYRGVLYAGLMLTPGGPRVLEFNCRFGDPECQALLPRIKGDLVEICWATATGGLANIDLSFDRRACCCVVVCSEGYPGSIETGRAISGLDEAQASAELGEEVILFHAGTKRSGQEVVTAGGRVIGVTALAPTLAAAQAAVNRAAACVQFKGAFFRRDIGSAAVTANEAPRVRAAPAEMKRPH